MKKLKIFLLLAAALILLSLPHSASAYTSEMPKHKAGQNDALTWSYADGVLTISGKDKMTEFYVDGDENSEGYMVITSAPWTDLRGKVKTLVIEEGVSTVGWYAFNQFSVLTTVYLPKTVTQIDNGAFLGCSRLKTVNLAISKSEVYLTVGPENEPFNEAAWNFGTAYGYTVSYKLNGGTNAASNPSAYRPGSDAILLAAPKKTGYTFAGWYSDSGFTKKVTKIAAGSKGDKTFYAKWTANSYKVSFYKNSTAASGSMSAQSFTYGKSKALKANSFTRSGYVFAGWNTKSDGTGKNYANKATVKNLSSKDGGVIKLYARWVKSPIKRYTVSFNANGGSCATDSVKVVNTLKYGTLPTPKRTGYSFLGWYTAKSGGTKITASSKVSLTGSKTLYAHWKAHSYTVHYVTNGGKGSMDDSAATYGKSLTLRKNAFTRSGYSFTGWNTKADGSGKTYANKATVKNLTSTDGKTVKLYAQWEKKTLASYLMKNGDLVKEAENGSKASICYNAEEKTVTYSYWDASGNILYFTEAADGSSRTSCTFHAQGQLIALNGENVIGRGSFSLSSSSVTRAELKADSSIAWSGTMTYPYYAGFQLFKAEDYKAYATTMVGKGMERWTELLKGTGYTLKTEGFTSWE